MWPGRASPRSSTTPLHRADGEGRRTMVSASGPVAVEAVVSAFGRDRPHVPGPCRLEARRGRRPWPRVLGELDRASAQGRVRSMSAGDRKCPDMSSCAQARTYTGARAEDREGAGALETWGAAADRRWRRPSRLLCCSSCLPPVFHTYSGHVLESGAVRGERWARGASNNRMRCGE